MNLEILKDPENKLFEEKAPDQFEACFKTSRGDILFEFNRDWAPLGVDRFYHLATNGFYENTRFFRVIRGFMAQFGISGDPELSDIWRSAMLKDDPVKESNLPGTISYATSGEDSRTTQLFINFVNNSRLDDMGFTPLGQIIGGMDILTSLYAEYGEGAPQGIGPEQYRLQTEGNSYLESEFPELDHIIKIEIS